MSQVDFYRYYAKNSCDFQNQNQPLNSLLNSVGLEEFPVLLPRIPRTRPCKRSLESPLKTIFVLILSKVRYTSVKHRFVTFTCSTVGQCSAKEETFQRRCTRVAILRTADFANPSLSVGSCLKQQVVVDATRRSHRLPTISHFPIAQPNNRRLKISANIRVA